MSLKVTRNVTVPWSNVIFYRRLLSRFGKVPERDGQTREQEAQLSQRGLAYIVYLP